MTKSREIIWCVSDKCGLGIPGSVFDYIVDLRQVI